MKTNNIVRSLLFALTFAVLLSACSEEFIALETGKLPDEASFAAVKSSMRSGHSFSGVTIIDIFAQEKDEEPQTTVIDELVLTLNKPASKDLTAEIVIGSEFSAEYRAEVERRNQQAYAYWRKLGGNFTRTDYKSDFFPTANLQMSAETVTIKAGKTDSDKIVIKLSNKELDPETIYFLPLTVVLSDDNGTVIKSEYIIAVDKLSVTVDNGYVNTKEKIEMNQELFTVLYLNVEEYQPQAANVLVYQRGYMDEEYMRHTEYTLAGNVVNLRPSTVGYAPESQRVIFSLSPDLNYVLENSARYIRPLQAAGRKVCICIQGGGKGIGFCNMSDAQIEDFTAQVKNVVESYGIDGINLRDEGSGYGKEGFPAMNTTSYPKLIKSLREALPGKILTLVDKDEPTEYFHDAALCGGIEVGKYIDYAWHGYFSAEEQPQIIEPWDEENKYSDYKRKPIAGLTPEKYGNINIPRQPTGEVEAGYRKVMNWCSEGRKKNNILVFGFDLTANEQDGVFEGQPHIGAFGYIWYFADDGMRPQTLPSGEIVEDCKIFYDIKSSYQPYHYGYKVFWKDW